MWFFVNKNTNKVEGHSGLVQAGDSLSLVPLAHALPNFLASRPDLAESDLAFFQVTALENAEALTAVNLDQLEPTLNIDIVESIEVISDAPASELWLHGSISGGTVNQLTGTRYIERGQTLTYSATIHVDSDPGSAQVTEVPGSDPPEPLSGSWALECIHELNIDQFSPMVTMTAGVISGSVIIPDRLRDGLFMLPEERMATLGGIKLRLADPAAFEFKVRS